MIYDFNKKVKASLQEQRYKKEDIEYVWVDILSPIAQDSYYCQDFVISYNNSELERALSKYTVQCEIYPSQTYGDGEAHHLERAYAPDKTKNYTYDSTKNIYTNNETGNALLASLSFWGGGKEIPSYVIQKNNQRYFLYRPTRRI